MILKLTVQRSLSWLHALQYCNQRGFLVNSTCASRSLPLVFCCSACSSWCCCLAFSSWCCRSVFLLALSFNYTSGTQKHFYFIFLYLFCFIAVNLNALLISLCASYGFRIISQRLHKPNLKTLAYLTAYIISYDAHFNIRHIYVQMFSLLRYIISVSL